MAKFSYPTGLLFSEAVPLKLKGCRGSDGMDRVSWRTAKQGGGGDVPSPAGEGTRTGVVVPREAVGLIMNGSTTLRESRTCWTCREKEARRALRHEVSRQFSSCESRTRTHRSLRGLVTLCSSLRGIVCASYEGQSEVSRSSLDLRRNEATHSSRRASPLRPSQTSSR